MRIIFILPTSGLSGGTRVTVKMAEMLDKLGIETYILYKIPPVLSIKSLKYQSKKAVLQIITKKKKIDWIRHCDVTCKSFINLKDELFVKGDIIIAVGSYTIKDVAKLHEVKKIRYCHGYNLLDMDFTNSVWSIPMDTIAVAQTLEPLYKKISKTNFLSIIPNGIDLNDYRNDGDSKDGIGMIYSSNPIKNPEGMIIISKLLQKELPNVPLYIFSTEKRPKNLITSNYFRLPSISKAREIYNKSQIWIIPSISEGFSVPILEAMACGAIVISSDTFGSRELIKNNQNGFIVPVGDYTSVISIVKKVLNNNNLISKITRNGMKTVSEYSWEKSALRMYNFLTDYIKE